MLAKLSRNLVAFLQGSTTKSLSVALRFSPFAQPGVAWFVFGEFIQQPLQ